MKTGTQVQFGGRGPVMTVRSAVDTDLRCRWLNSNGDMQEDVFAPEELQELPEATLPDEIEVPGPEPRRRGYGRMD